MERKSAKPNRKSGSDAAALLPNDNYEPLHEDLSPRELADVLTRNMRREIAETLTRKKRQFRKSR